MLTKLYKVAALAGLLVAAGAVPALAQAEMPARISRITLPSPVAEIWGRTATYVYEDDPVLQDFSDDLEATIQRGGLKNFSHGIDDAVRVAQRHKKGVENVLQFEELFKTVQGQRPTTLPQLAAAIEEQLENSPERTADSTRRARFTAFRTQLDMFAAVQAEAQAKLEARRRDSIGLLPRVAKASVTAPAIAQEQHEDGSGTSLWTWLALGTSLLSLAGVVYIILRPLPVAEVVAAADAQAAPRASHQRNVKWSEIENYVQRELDNRMKAAPAAMAAAPPTQGGAASGAWAGAASATSQAHTQYVNQAPHNGTFPARALSEQPSQHSVFAIDYTDDNPGTGYFQVTGNQASHVRDHRALLEPVCVYLGYPSGNETRITTVEPGQVQRRADGAWHVTHRARIRFEA